MKPKRLLYWLLVLGGISGIAGLTAWDFYQVRSAGLAADRRWEKRVSRLLTAERESLTLWIQHFSIESSTFRDIANSRQGVAALFLIDNARRTTDGWTRPRLDDALEPLDPRVAVLQLTAIDKKKALTGPI